MVIHVPHFSWFTKCHEKKKKLVLKLIINVLIVFSLLFSNVTVVYSTKFYCTAHNSTRCNQLLIGYTILALDEVCLMKTDS